MGDDGLIKLRSAAAMICGELVAGSDVPIVPCHLRGTFEACPAGSIFPRPDKITINIGQPLRFPNVANDREGWDIIIGQVEKAIRKLGEGS